MSAPKKDSGRVFVVQLEDEQYLDTTLFRLQRGAVVRFRLGPSLYGRQVSVYTNMPATESDPFCRDRFRRLGWMASHGEHTGPVAILPIIASGSFRYYFTHTEGRDPNPRGSGYFLVDPILSYGGSGGETLPMDCVQCQTVISKCLGPIDQWEGRLRVAFECGYNMVHFTPVQELGASNSAYSLADQLKLNPAFNYSDGQTATLTDVELVLKKMCADWKVLSVCDIVLNHTSNESPWLREHPECAYNMVNSGHLRPAYLLDRVVDCLARDMLKGRWKDRGLDGDVTEEHHLQIIRELLHQEYLPSARFHEFFQADPDRVAAEFMASCRGLRPHVTAGDEQLQLLPAVEGRRLGCSVQLSLARRRFYIERPDAEGSGSLVELAAAELRDHVHQLNARAAEATLAHLAAAVENIISGIRYERLAHDGPRLRGITWRTPLVAPYFTTLEGAGSLLVDRSLAAEEAVMYGDSAALLMAHNGWVMGDDPLRDFARPGSNVYFRRELIAWGDSVKLRYGARPDDCPYLWDRMRQYVEQVARMFHGIRLDNCHSTPIHVAEYLLDAARKVRPDLYVIAELFTNSDCTDNLFVNRLGINSLIREAMSAGDSHEQGRLVYLYGGQPVGSFLQAGSGPQPLLPSRAHALFLDQTHDNRSPVETRSAFDMLPSAALVAMACCATGSSRGYDELVPHHIHVVDEKRLYCSWCGGVGPGRVDAHTGIIRGRRLLSKLHYQLGSEGFTQVFVDQVSADIVTVTRHNPVDHRSVVLSAHTAFHPPAALHTPDHLPPIRVQGTVAQVAFHAKLVPINGRPLIAERMTRIEGYIGGLDQYQLEIGEEVSVEECGMLSPRRDGDYTLLEYKDFPPGSVVVLRVDPIPSAVASVKRLRATMAGLETGGSSQQELMRIISSLSLSDLNRVLYRCDDEERDEGRGSGAYNVPDVGPFVYCGLQSIVTMMSNIGPRNDLGHPLCGNLRQGDWLMEYIVSRLSVESSTAELSSWLQGTFGQVRELPRYLIPAYFCAVVQVVYRLLLQRVWTLMSAFVRDGSELVKRLALGSVQMAGIVQSAPLPQLSPQLAAPRPASRTAPDGTTQQACVTLSAGLPHFSTGYMRNWGRDTFIALRGLFLLTGRLQEARCMLLAYAGCLRHGLIPNLLDAGRNARFNCRDSVWWWLYSIQEYVRLAPDGVAILQDQVCRIFPHDDSPPQPPAHNNTQPLHAVMQEAVQRHFEGVSFRERNAGHQIDQHMTDQGFNNHVGVDKKTGFVYGGNADNCGTWMDKMGSSELAGNRGRPATSRNGSAVEIVALSRATVGWLATLPQDQYPYTGVTGTDDTGAAVQWTWQQWTDRIDANFERHFYMPAVEGSEDSDVVPLGGMYKDSLNASHEWADRQLRCNFPIAMVVAPEMFDAGHAWTALETCDRHLRGPLGMKTLYEKDWAYCGYYDNDNHGSDPKVADGFNYHNGPEWVWPMGYFLRALLQFTPRVGGPALLDATVAKCRQVMSRHYAEVCDSTWRSLPELTDRDGSPCRFSCQAQAWSMGCLLEVLHHITSLSEGCH